MNAPSLTPVQLSLIATMNRWQGSRLHTGFVEDIRASLEAHGVTVHQCPACERWVPEGDGHGVAVGHSSERWTCREREEPEPDYLEMDGPMETTPC